MPHLMGHRVMVDGLVLRVMVDGLGLGYPVVFVGSSPLLGGAFRSWFGGARGIAPQRRGARTLPRCLTSVRGGILGLVALRRRLGGSTRVVLRGGTGASIFSGSLLGFPPRVRSRLASGSVFRG